MQSLRHTQTHKSVLSTDPVHGIGQAFDGLVVLQNCMH